MFDGAERIRFHRRLAVRNLPSGAGADHILRPAGLSDQIAAQDPINGGRQMTTNLGPGEEFPAMRLDLAGGGAIDLPSDLKASYSVILFYRGHW